MNELRECLSSSKPAASAHQVSTAAGQLWRFANEIENGDMVVLPRKTPRVVAVGRVAGGYLYRPDCPYLADTRVPHIRRVDWRVSDVPRPNFDQDLLSSFGYRRTVFRVNIDNAASRIERVVNAHLDGQPASEQPTIESEPQTLIPDDDVPDSNLDEQIEDRIVQRIRQRFPGTRLEYLVAEILKASGYSAAQTRLGPDGGIDVVAGMGDMGFGEPRLCVQVKSGAAPIGLPDYNRLQGNIQGFGAQYGLLVSLADFTSAVRKENERSFFQIRLWGPYELVERLLETYDSLPVDIRADIPLRTRRVLVESED